MPRENHSELDAKRLLILLSEADVAFVIVGGMAAVYAGTLAALRRALAAEHRDRPRRVPRRSPRSRPFTTRSPAFAPKVSGSLE